MTTSQKFLTPSARVRWYQRDLLAARDLTAEAAIESRWRQLHVRSLHQTWGVALGLHPATSDGGDWLLVGPGFALDACQRELILDHSLLVGPPAPPPGVAAAGWWFDLVVRLEHGAPAWRWLYAGPWSSTDLEPPLLAAAALVGVDVPITRVVLRPGGTMSAVDSSLRRGTRRSSHRIVTGRIAPGASLSPGSTTRLWSFNIDFSSARFRLPPIVFASLESYPLAAAVAVPALMLQLLGPFIEIGSPSTTSVPVRVVFALAGTTGTFPSNIITSLSVPIRWMAIEPHDPPEPSIVLDQARTLDGRAVPNLAAKFTRLQTYPPPGGVTVS